MTIQLSEQERKIILEALNAMRDREVRNAQFYHIGGIERERCNLRIEAIFGLTKRLESMR